MEVFQSLLLVLIFYYQGAQVDAAHEGEDRFLPYGATASDTSVNITSRRLLGPISLKHPIFIYNKRIDSLFISSDVLIASEKSVTDIHTHHFAHFPRFIYPELPLIAPLWASFRSVQLHHRVAEDSQTLQHVADMISSRNGNLSDYSPKLAVVLTVIDAVPAFDSTQRVSFQAVISTDGRASFAAFLYASPGLLPNISGDYQIGFDAGDGVRGLVLLGTNRMDHIDPLQSINIYRIDGSCVTGILDGQVCLLNSQSTGCSNASVLTTNNCLCNSDVTEVDNCQGDAEYNCPVNSTHINCSAKFPICLVSDYVCDKIADCDEAADETADICNHGHSLLPFGPGIDDDENDITSLTSYEVGHVDTPIVFYRQNLTNIHVSTNGLLTFNNGFAGSRVEGLPRTSFPTVPLITPLWTSFISQDEGILFRRITNDSIHLGWAKDMLMEYSTGVGDFNPKVAVIATWLDFSLPNQNDVVFHQVVLSSDGVVTFAAFVYDDSTISAAHNFKGGIIAGFDAGDGVRSATIHTPGLSHLQNVNLYRIDGHCITLANHSCGLNSYAVECTDDFVAAKCRCYSSANTSECEVDGAYSCEAGSTAAMCHEADDFELLQCFPNGLICNLNAECSDANDEKGCTESQRHGFLLFGNGANDTQSDSILNDEETIFSIALPAPIIFYEEPQMNIYVSNNGLVSFEEHYHSSRIRSFPSISLSAPIIAPLWTTFLPSLSGPVYHRIAQDSDTLEKVAQMIADENSELDGYLPSVAVIISWYEARFPEDESRRTHQYDNEMTFQLIVSSDGNLSFAALIYKDPSKLMELQEPKQVGFNSGKGRGISILSDEDLPGVNLFRIDGSCITKVSSGYACNLLQSTLECDELFASTVCRCDRGEGAQCVEKNRTAQIHEEPSAPSSGGSPTARVGGTVAGLLVFSAAVAVLIAAATIVIFRKHRRAKRRDYSQDFDGKINIYGLKYDEKNNILET